MPKALDLTGVRFGSLVAISRRRRPGKTAWLCWCDCGGEVVVITDSIRSERTRSCGCLHKSLHTTHGMHGTRTYKTWEGMLARCRNHNNRGYKRYGGRGITICPRWQCFENFLADMGERPPAMSLDRIDNDGNYEPCNCRWATDEQQLNNTSRNVMLTFQGLTMTRTQWARKLGVRPSLLLGRMRRGWSVEKLLSEPSRRDA